MIILIKLFMGICKIISIVNLINKSQILCIIFRVDLTIIRSMNNHVKIYHNKWFTLWHIDTEILLGVLKSNTCSFAFAFSFFLLYYVDDSDNSIVPKTLMQGCKWHLITWSQFAWNLVDTDMNFSKFGIG